MRNRGRGYGAADRVAWRIFALAVLALCMAPLVARALPVVDPTTSRTGLGRPKGLG